jgi:hypothetical protein
MLHRGEMFIKLRKKKVMNGIYFKDKTYITHTFVYPIYYT